MIRYEYACSEGHEQVVPRPVSECAAPGPTCKCGRATKRKFSVPRWNMFVTTQEAFEWADRVQSGEEKITADKTPEGRLAHF
jgi:hypothetical protein